MRQDLLYFLMSLEDEHVISSLMNNMNREDLSTLFHYLSYASPESLERWQSVYEKIMLHTF
ncbi:hypothetical protein PAECIP111893_02910 [Paenibacillus plantiphilus]|uniref:Uncharacterized protein n=1 Tax=Paenibacillus plantiphilus TaxID=2905650 RepID=A0ABN8GJ58_9BACL|nr:hypothetical protein [Paenibacillus plantiphilus]CAH1208821.1 hypothetical protein PAECIP111893_02910 [Paenibacillus plantiphilus]